jgi:hypothetical protein
MADMDLGAFIVAGGAAFVGFWVFAYAVGVVCAACIAAWRGVRWLLGVR